MPMGAALMNYMGHYVGALAVIGKRPLLTMVLAWHPWAVIRIVSFVTLGVLLSAPLLSKLFAFRIDWAAARPLAIAAVAGLVLDVVLKALLAPTWQRLLLRWLEPTQRRLPKSCSGSPSATCDAGQTVCR